MKEIKNGRSKLVSCDAVALKTLITSKGFTPTQLAKLLDYQPGYFSKTFSKKKIGVNCARLLYEKIGIKPEQYGVFGIDFDDTAVPRKKKLTAKEKVIQKKSNKPSASTITIQLQVDAKDLKELIKEAVLEAFDEI